MDSSTSGIIIGIVIVIVLSIFIVAIMIGWNLSSKSNNTPLITLQQSGILLSSCINTICAPNFTCDPNSFVCKKSLGEICNSFGDCATGLICSGRCATGGTGGLNQYCPCKQGFICVPQPDGYNICKGKGGTPCETAVDCASGACDNNGICSTGAANSFPCTSNSQCASGYCSNGYCQFSGIITGTIGAACSDNCVSFIGSGCSGTISRPLACECVDGVGNPGMCVAANQGVIDPCSSSLACANQLICLNGTGDYCDTNDTSCICNFSYTNANDFEQQCINGMSSKLGGCFNNSRLGCDSGGQCTNSACGGDSVLAVYKFSSTSEPNLKSNFIGATTIGIKPAISGPTGLIKPYKMFSISIGTVDSIYLVDEIQGLQLLQYDPINEVVVSPWVQLIPPTTVTPTSTKVLIDASYNQSRFVVAFHETTQSGSNYTAYIGDTITNLNPIYNPGSGITGTQYGPGGIPLSIEYIDISRGNDASSGGDILISTGGTIYIKSPAESSYTIGIIQGGPRNNQQMVGTTGPARFYFDNIENATAPGTPTCPGLGTNPIKCASRYNVSFIAPFTSFGGATFDQVLQFSGNVAGLSQPTDRFGDVQYRVFDYGLNSSSPLGMTDSSIVMLTQAYQNNIFIDDIVNISHGGNVSPFPYRISSTSRSVATENGIYIISIGSCT